MDVHEVTRALRWTKQGRKQVGRHAGMPLGHQFVVEPGLEGYGYDVSLHTRSAITPLAIRETEAEGKAYAEQADLALRMD